MKPLTTSFAACALALLLFASPAKADFDSFRDWLVCGGNAFNTCASVQVGIGPEVDGTSTVTMRVWNLSGAEYRGSDTWASTVFTKIGFYNIGGDAMAQSGSLSMYGPARDGDDPAEWVLGDNNDAGGVSLEMATSGNEGNSSVDNSIANDCGPDDELPGGSNELWQNPCAADDPLDLPDPGETTQSAVDAGWIVMTFDITGTWDLESSELLIMGQNGPDGDSTQCDTGENCEVIPEPLTMALLGTGLAGLGGAGLAQRRRRREEGVESGEDDELG